MKRYMLALCSFVMLLGLLLNCYFSVNANENDLVPFDFLAWDTYCPGKLKGFNPNQSRCYYSIQLSEPNGGFFQMNSYINPKPGTTFFSADLRNRFNASGTYTCVVKTYYDEDGYNNNKNDADKEKISNTITYEYTQPQIQLSAPTDVKWSDSNNGFAQWTAVTDADKYELALYRKENGSSVLKATASNVQDCSFDFRTYLKEDGVYYVKVQALNNDITDKANSDWSEFSNGYNYNAIEGELSSHISVSSNTLSGNTISGNTISGNTISGNTISGNTISGNSVSASEVNSEVSYIKNSFTGNKKDSLAREMQENSKVNTLIENLEKNFVGANPIRYDKQIDSSLGNVKVVGAALNATANNDTVQLTINKTDANSEILIDSDKYKNTVQLNIELKVNNTKLSVLDVPITITMPIPHGIDPSKLEILHFSNNGTYETIIPKINGDGTCTFTVTHFSQFIFAEGTIPHSTSQYVEESEEQDKVVEDWKPTTPQDLFRYCLRGYEKNSFVVKEGLPYKVGIRNEVQGQKFFDSINTIRNGYTLARTYNILPDNKCTYSMKNPATITLTIPKSVQKDGRKWVLFGVKEDGTPYILKDSDKNMSTITITTNSFYAFALGYKE